MRRYIAVISILLSVTALITVPTEGRKLKLKLPETKSGKTELHQFETLIITEESQDETGYSLADIDFSGYDKPVNASKETLFITNHTDRQLCDVSFTIDYLDVNGKGLHSRTVSLRTDIPAGETRMISFPTWDTNGSFRYAGSRPSRRQAYTYTIKLTPVSYRLLKK